MTMKIQAILFTFLMTMAFQLSAQRVTVPLCDKIEVVNIEMEKQLGLFPEYEDFQQALMYKEGDNLFVLEIIYKSNNIFQID